MYGLLLDAIKAFDHVNYCKLLTTLLDRKVYHLYCRLLHNMYINQKLRIRWGITNSSYFNVTTVVKCGGVISPILFGIYMDGLLNEFSKSNVGCHIGVEFVGVYGYADDLLKTFPPFHYPKR